MREEETFPIEEESDFTRPFDRGGDAQSLSGGVIGHDAQLAYIAQLIREDKFYGGWIIGGESGIGKATLAAQITKAFLLPDAIINQENLCTDQSAKGMEWINQYAHPELKYIRRVWNKDAKPQKFFSEIRIDDIRKLSRFINMSAGNNAGRKMIIIDKADELNNNAANAFLKLLEEPSERTTILLLSDAYKRILPTIKSRCKRIILNPVDDENMHRFLLAEANHLDADFNDDTIQNVIKSAGGRPGYALALLSDGSGSAAQLVDDFLGALLTPNNAPNLSKIITSVSGVKNEMAYKTFSILLLKTISNIAKAGINGGALSAVELQIQPSLPPHAWATYWATSQDLFQNARAINIDKGQVIMSLHQQYTKLLSTAYVA